MALEDSKTKSWAICDDEFQNYLKRSEPSAPTRYSNLTMKLDDLPDSLLTEILVRLPTKSIARDKCVSKRWLALISHRTFLSHYLYLQCDNPNSNLVEPTVIFFNNVGISTTTRSFSLDFLLIETPVILSSCNDLVLCCPYKKYQSDYHVCNLFTKQWTALPPSPQWFDNKAIVGFICEPYYYYKNDSSSQSRSHGYQISNNNVHVNVDYKYAVVRILSSTFSLETPKLEVEIFSSQTGEWSDFELSFPPLFDFDCLSSPGFAYKGKLYWRHNHYVDDCNFMFALDPFSNGDYFDVVDLPCTKRAVLSVSQEGRLRLIDHLFFGTISIWELRDEKGEDDKVGGGFGKWCEIVSHPPYTMVLSDPLIRQRVRSVGHFFLEGACDPSNDDICYVESNIKDNSIILKCNIGKNTMELARLSNEWNGYCLKSTFQYMVPRWPTPVPKINYKSTTTTMMQAISKVVLFARDLRQFSVSRLPI